MKRTKTLTDSEWRGIQEKEKEEKSTQYKCDPTKCQKLLDRVSLLEEKLEDIYDALDFMEDSEEDQD